MLADLFLTSTTVSEEISFYLLNPCICKAKIISLDKEALYKCIDT